MTAPKNAGYMGMSGYVAEERMAIWKKGAKSANSESSPARYESR